MAFPYKKVLVLGATSGSYYSCNCFFIDEMMSRKTKRKQ
jgi:hypothetical protein